jgi:hypothetical protein
MNPTKNTALSKTPAAGKEERFRRTPVRFRAPTGWPERFFKGDFQLSAARFSMCCDRS